MDRTRFPVENSSKLKLKAKNTKHKSPLEMFFEKGALKFRITLWKTLVSESFLMKLQALGLQLYFIKKETPAHVFSCKFYEIFKNTFDRCFWKQTLLKTSLSFNNLEGKVFT